MPNIIRSFNIDSQAQSEALAPMANGDGFEVLVPAQFPSFVPQSFREKCDSATRVVSGSGSDQAIVVYNFRRLDRTNVDEHPFGYIVVSGSQAVSGSFLEHGDWDGRTTPVSHAFTAHVSASGLGGFFLAHPFHGRVSGSLAELTGSDATAFEQFRQALIPAPL